MCFNGLQESGCGSTDFKRPDMVQRTSRVRIWFKWQQEPGCRSLEVSVRQGTVTNKRSEQCGELEG